LFEGFYICIEIVYLELIDRFYVVLGPILESLFQVVHSVELIDRFYVVLGPNLESLFQVVHSVELIDRFYVVLGPMINLVDGQSV